ncbi:MAG: hypothetical protein ACREQW_18305 [Candidatus Binatia bacterium]
MKVQTIRERLKAVLESLSYGNKKNVVANSFILLGEAGIFDSVAALRLVLALEKEFEIVVEDGDLNPDNFGSFERLEKYIQDKFNTK